MRSALVVGAGLALTVGVFLGWVTNRASRSWTDWKKARAAVPPAKKAAYGHARYAVQSWILVALIVIILITAATLAQRPD